MKVIKDGDCYNQELKKSYPWGDLTYNTLKEPDKTSVLNMLAGIPLPPVLQHINYYLCKVDAGWIFTFDDKLSLDFKYYEFVDWLRDQYERKQFSWQKEENV